MKKETEVFKNEIHRVKEFLNKLKKTPGIKDFNIIEPEGGGINLEGIKEFNNYDELFEFLEYPISTLVDFGPSLVTDFESAMVMRDIIDEINSYEIGGSERESISFKKDFVILKFEGDSQVYTKDEFVELMKEQVTDEEMVRGIERNGDIRCFIECHPILSKLDEERREIVEYYFEKWESVYN